MKKKDEKHDIKKDFLKVMEKKEINTYYQPIVSLRDGSTLGCEALSRGPKESILESPEILLDLAKKYNALWELECLMRFKALENAEKLNFNSKIFLNVNPNIIHDKRFKKGFTKDFLAQFSISRDKIVFEITEREVISNPGDFMDVVNHYKKQDYKIAIDDAGAGYSGLNLISDVQPHFLKLDMQLIRNLDTEPNKQALIKALQQFALTTNTHLIAEGIETEQELIKLIEIGVHYGQGYFIQRPDPRILPINRDIIDIIIRENTKKNRYFGTRIFEFYIQNISRPTLTVSPKVLCSAVDEIFKENESLPGICVVDNNEILGVVTKNSFYKSLSTQFGYSLYTNKPVEKLLETDFLCVDGETTVDIVSRNAMVRTPEKIYDFIVVTVNNKYYGTVTIKDLLEKTIEIEVMNAKNLNPLSELPGNVVIERELERAIALGEDYTVLYFDLDNFKAYNDVYGFENGDRVLKYFAKLLKTHANDNFIGHIGGDDFILMLKQEKGEEICKEIIFNFNKEIVLFYKECDIAKGYISAKNRMGIDESFPIISISIAGVSTYGYNNLYELAEAAGKLKKICKQKSGSNFLIADKFWDGSEIIAENEEPLLV